jgi:hypothetical protein
MKGQDIMGDKSPKAAQKHASQKQLKTDQADQKKRQDIANKQAPSLKKK